MKTQSKVKHTPEQTQNYKNEWLVIYSDDEEVLDVKTAKDKYEAMEKVRNSRESTDGNISAHVVPLSVAAKSMELLDACRAMMEYWNFNGVDHNRREMLFNIAHDKMQAAIAKVEGGNGK
jgi:hypothetical protein